MGLECSMHGLSLQSSQFSSAMASSGVREMGKRRCTSPSCQPSLSSMLSEEPVESVEQPTEGGLTGLSDGGLCEMSRDSGGCPVEGQCRSINIKGWFPSLLVRGREGMLSLRIRRSGKPRNSEGRVRTQKSLSKCSEVKIIKSDY